MLFPVVAALAVAGRSAQVAPPNSFPRASISVSRQITTDDLMDLRDIGGDVDRTPPFSLSPDGSFIATVVRQPDAAADTYRQMILVVRVRDARIVSQLRLHGAVELQRFDRGQLTDFGGGSIISVKLLWSGDGQSILYIEREKGETRLQEADIPSAASRTIFSTTEDVRDYRWSPDTQSLLLEIRSPDVVAKRALEEEGRHGFRYDARWDPLWRSTPFPPAGISRWVAVNPHSGEQSLSAPPQDEPDGVARSSKGVARLVNTIPAWSLGAWKISVQLADGRSLNCSGSLCSNARELWWASDGRALLFRRRGGWGNELSEIVRWNLGTNTFRTIVSTRDLIENCASSPSGLICPVEGSAAPRKLVLINERLGAQRTLLNVNPQWDSLEKGRVTRLHWRNILGLECYGDLVLPPGQISQKSLPLIVVGYESRGFLRGGSGNAVPIFPLAARGYAVLVYNLARFVGELTPAGSYDEMNRRSYKNWADDRSQTSSIMTAIEMLVHNKTVDPGRIGLTGFSAGNERGIWTLLHFNAFRAISLMTCCDDPVALRTVIGPTLSDYALSIGFPQFDYSNGSTSREYSIAASAKNIKAPILIQNSDREFLMMLESEAMLREAGKPVAAYVYPDEYHNFWQPAHILSSYDRTIAWFDYYILGKQDVDLIDPADIESWGKLPPASPPSAVEVGTVLAQAVQNRAQVSASASSRSRR